MNRWLYTPFEPNAGNSVAAPLKGWCRAMSDNISASYKGHCIPACQGLSVNSLAREARMSRSVLALRFRTVLEPETPLEYLTPWRSTGRCPLFRCETQCRSPPMWPQPLDTDRKVPSDSRFLARDGLRFSSGNIHAVRVSSSAIGSKRVKTYGVLPYGIKPVSSVRPVVSISAPWQSTSDGLLPNLLGTNPVPPRLAFSVRNPARCPSPTPFQLPRSSVASNARSLVVFSLD